MSAFAAGVSLLALASFAVSAAEPPPRRPDRPRERAAWNAVLREDSRGAVLQENRLRALRQACELPDDPAMSPPRAGSLRRSDVGPSEPAGAATTAWQPLGPRPALSGYPGLGTVSGRIAALAVHPTNPAIVLVGSATGGIWKSTDGGRTFRPVSDTAPALATSALAFSRSNASIVFAATGELDSAYLECQPQRSLGTYLGAGLLRSADAGDTWTRIDADLPTGAIVSRVAVHPTNPQLVVAGVYIVQDPAANVSRVGGLYRSTDGGVHFTRTYDHAVSDLAVDPRSDDTLYAAFAVGYDANGYCQPGGRPSGIYRSTDFGLTWQPLLVASTASGALFAPPTSLIKVAAGPLANGTALYASVLDKEDLHAAGGIFSSTDGGATWSRAQVVGDMCGVQCDYNHFLLADPQDGQTVYFGAIDLYRSTDGAASWVKLVDFYGGGTPVHPDQHAALLVPGSATSPTPTLFLANDGGLYRSTDGGSYFESLNDTLTLEQFNGIALHAANPDWAIGGTQDNGNLRYTSSLLWTDRTQGDGGFNLVRSDDPSQVLSANYWAYLNYSRDGGDTYTDVTECLQLMRCTDGDNREPMAFYPPAIAAPDAPGTVFLGTNRVWANPTFGAQQSAWKPRSGTAATSSVITALATVGDGSGAFWIGTRIGEVFFSEDGAAHGELRATGLPALVITKIQPVSADGRAAFVSVGGFTGSPSRHVFYTPDAGASWRNVSGNLPDVPVASFAVDPGDPSNLYVGTDVGVFRSTNGGASWASFNQGLPNVTVTDLRFHPVTRDLWAATYGRGVFRIAASASGTVSPVADFIFSPSVPAPGESVAFTDRSGGVPTSWRWDFGDGTAAAIDPSPHHTYAQPGGYAVTLAASNAAGSSTKTVSVVVVAGLPSSVVLQLPVVLDVFGVPPAHYTSDLVAVNRGSVPTRLTLAYTPAPGTPGAGGPRLGETLAPSAELRIPDVVDYLRRNGWALPPSGPAMVGTLRLTFEDVADGSLVFAGSRASTPNPDTVVGGSFGLFASAVSPEEAATQTLSVFGLREDAAYRSNLAVVDVPPAHGGAAAALSSFSVQVIDGDTGFAAGSPETFSLATGEWRQLSSLLASKGVKNGWVTVTKTGGGGDLFTAYGVVNDGPASGGGTSDGSFVPPQAASGDSLLPIVLRVSSAGVLYRTELVLANPGAVSSVVLTYVPADSLLPGTSSTAMLTLPAGRQLRRDDAIAFLRDELGMALAPGETNQGGTLFVTGAVALARVYSANPNPQVGGTFGLAFPAVTPAQRAKTEAWVYDLVQDATSRSNLAIADARQGGASVTYQVELFDAVAADGFPRKVLTVTLGPGQWAQLSKVLDGSGISHGYAQVRPVGGASDFVTYGVVNDGASPGDRTSDGSYVAMSGVR